MNRHRTRPDSGQRLGGDAGAILIEFTMVFPFMLVLTLGIAEFGYAYRSSIIVSDTASAGIRSLANTGPERSADYNALLSVRAGLDGLPPDSTPKRVVIFDADAAPGVIDNCKTMVAPPNTSTGIPGVCNVYSWEAVQLATPLNFTGPDDCDSGDWDYRFCPTDREDDPAVGLTAVGIWVDVEHETVTNMFPFVTLQLDEQRIMHLEPGEHEVAP